MQPRIGPASPAARRRMSGKRPSGVTSIAARGLHEHPLPDLVGLVKPHGARHVRPAQPVAAPFQYELGSSCRRRSTDPDRREESPRLRSPPFRRGRARAKARATALPNNQFDTGTNTAKKFSRQYFAEHRRNGHSSPKSKRNCTQSAQASGVLPTVRPMSRTLRPWKSTPASSSSDTRQSASNG